VAISPRTRSIVKIAAVPIGILLSAVLVLGSSYSSFSAKNANTGNTWGTSSLGLNTPVYQALFDNGNNPANKSSPDFSMWPNAVYSNTIQINYTGNTPATVKMFAYLGGDPSSIAQYLKLKINDGTSDIYNGTLAAFTTSSTNYATGVGAWSVSANASRTYTVTVTLDGATPQTVANAAVTGTTFTWEAHNN
jgi:hypothetical protein